MDLEHQAASQVDALLHKLLERQGEPLPYCSDWNHAIAALSVAARIIQDLEWVQFYLQFDDKQGQYPVWTVVELTVAEDGDHRTVDAVVNAILPRPICEAIIKILEMQADPAYKGKGK